MHRIVRSLNFASWQLALLALSMVYGLYIRQQSQALSLELMAPLNVWDHILTFLLDPYYISYLFVPLWLCSSCVSIQRHFSVPALIRLGSYRSWLYSSTLHALGRLVPLLLIWLVSATVTAAGLPLSLDWSATSTVRNPLNQVLGIVSNHGIPPLLLVALQPMLVGLTLLCLHMVLALVYLLSSKQVVIYAAAAALFLAQLISFRNPFEFAPFLDFANFFLLHRSFSSYDPVALVFLPVIAVIGLCVAAVIYQDRRRRRTPWRLPGSFSALLYIGLCALGLIYALAFELRNEVGTPLDVLFVAFYGVSAAGFEWNLYLYHSIVFLGFAYLFLLVLENELKARIYYVALRHGSPTRWFSRFILPVAARVPLLLGALFAGALLIGSAGGLTAERGALADLGLGQGWALYQFFVNGTLQLLCYILLVFVIGWLSGRPMAGLFALGGLLVAGLPAINSARLLPAALNSLGYVELGGQELLRITAVLSAYCLALLLSAILIVKSPKLFFNERV